MLNDKPEERDTLFKEIVLKKTSVRMVEQMARRLAQDKIRKHDKTPEMMALEKSLTETLGTRVLIENRPQGGRLLIEFFSPEDLSHIAAILATQEETVTQEAEQPAATPGEPEVFPNTTQIQPVDAAPPAAVEEDLYSVRNFSV